MSNSSPFFARGGLIAAPGTRTIVSSGNTAQRPSVPSPGEIRYNTDIATYEFWFSGNSTWLSPAAGQNQTNLTVISLVANTIAVSNSVTLGLVAIGPNGVSVGNSTSNTVIGQTTIVVGNTTVNSTGFGIGNSTVSMTGNSTTLVIGATNMNSSSLTVGGYVINASGFTGAANTANNASFLGGVAAGSYATTSSLSSYQTISGLGTAVAGLSANNSAYLGGVAASNFWTQSNLVYVTQLNNNAGYITAASIPTNVSSFNNNVGYITGLNAGAGYTVSVMVANNYLQAGNYVYSSGNVYAVGDVYCSYSDGKLKILKRRVVNALDKVDRLNGWYYERNDVAPDLVPNDGRLRVGLIAQEVEAVLPEAVSFIKDSEMNDTEYKTLNTDMLFPLLVEAIKELRVEVISLRAEVKSLRGI